LGVLSSIAVRYAADFIYTRFSRAGLTPALPYSHQRSPEYAVDVYLLPFEGFPEKVADDVAAVLSEETGLNVQSSLAIPLDQAVFNRERKQYISDSLHTPIQQARASQRYATEKTVFIGLLDGDIYPESGDWNFMFSMHWGDGISVVANARMIPAGFMSSSQASVIYGERLLKMVKRTIGMQYYGYKRSSDPASVMYSPILGVQDLDRMGYAF
jgi:predicted Zn-dependent protease